MTKHYVSLYRKYRPNLFKNLVSQKQVKNVLQNSIIKQEISHAYLFNGPRGTGKTSTAYIFAKAINCINNINGDACNKCKNCLLINNNETFDIVEIDAASNNGVDNIRDLTDKVTYNPLNLIYKVYIIDEVHMLSKGAFNALLKTLEEPPKHAIFILATTEIKKIPITIMSRTQKHNFQKIKLPELTKHLERISKKENIEIVDQDTLLNISFLAEGCVRDALSLLEQVAIYQDNKIDNNGLLELFNYVTISKQSNIIKALINKDQKNILELINYFQDKAINYHALIKSLIFLLNSNLNKNELNLALNLKENLNNALLLLKKLIEFETLIQESKMPQITFQLLLLDNLDLNINKKNIIIKDDTKEVLKPTIKLEVKPIVSKEVVIVKPQVIKKLDQVVELNEDKILLSCASNNDIDELKQLKLNWNNIKSNILNDSIDRKALFITNAKPLWIYQNNLIIGFKEAIEVENFNINKTEFIKNINNSIDSNHNIIAIDRNKWVEIKKQLKNKLLYKNDSKENDIDKYRNEIFS